MIYQNNVKIFWIEPTDRERRWLRRFSFASKTPCTGGNQYGCEATMVELGEFDIQYTKEGWIASEDRSMPHSDPRWPTTCKSCGRTFEEKDEWQVHAKQLYVRVDTGERYTLRDAPVGACWDAWWVHAGDRDSKEGCGWGIGADHRSLVVKCPDGWEWHIDNRCANCDSPEDNAHHCWVRHGKPEDGTLHVDKNGNSCRAGAGSIQTPSWHGFLHNGVLHT